MATAKQKEAYANIEEKVRELQAAIDGMREAEYETKFFGLNEWIEDLDVCLADLEQDMEESE